MTPKTSMKEFLGSNHPIETQQKLDYYIESNYPNIDFFSRIFFEKGFWQKMTQKNQPREFLFQQELKNVILSRDEYFIAQEWFMKGFDLDPNEVLA